VDAPSAVRRILSPRACAPSATATSRCCCRCYLIDLGFTALEVGAIATATLVGSGLLTLLVGLRAHRHSYRALLIAATVLMAAHRPGVRRGARLLAAAVDRDRRHAESVERRRQRVPAARARRALARRRRSRAHVGVRALQPRGRARGGGRRARRRAPAARRDPGDVRALRADRGRRGGRDTAGCRRRWSRGRNSAAAPLGPSKRRVYALAALFSLDAFGGGFVVQSLLALWLYERFELSSRAPGRCSSGPAC
jgi:hypothetical protein